MAQKNILFKFNADTSLVLKALDELNNKLTEFTKNTNIALKGGGVEKGQLNAAIKLAEAEQKNSIRRVAAEEKNAREREKQQRLLSIKEQESQERLSILRLREDRRQAAIDAARAAREANRASTRAAIPAAPTGPGFGDIVRGGLATFGILATVDALVDLSKSTIQAAIDFERLTASFRALIGDKERADVAIKDIQQFALETPFDVTNVALASKTLLGYGITADQLIPTLKRLGDVSAASGGDIQRVALAYGQIAAKGKLQGEEIRQLVNVGFNPLQEISQKTGESMAALAKRVEAGGVSFDEVAEAFERATSAGGRFFNLAATLTDTFGGQLQKLGEQINLFKIEIGSIAGEELRPLVENLSKFFNTLTESTKEVRANAFTLSIWKAALIFIVSLLAKSANAFLANTLASLNFRNAINFLSTSLRANITAIAAQTGAQRVAAIQTTLWNAATLTLRGSITLFGKALNGLYAIILRNPIGVILGLLTLWNGALERGKQITGDFYKELFGLQDLLEEYKKTQQETAASQKANNAIINTQFQAVRALVNQYGNQSKAAQDAIEKLEQEYGFRLDLAKATNNQKLALQTLIDAEEEAKKLRFNEQKIKDAEALIKKAQEDIDNTQEKIRVETIDFQNSQKKLKQTKEIIDVKSEESNAIQRFLFWSPKQQSEYRSTSKEVEFYTDEVNQNSEALQSLSTNLINNQNVLQKSKKDLADANAALLLIRRAWFANTKGAKDFGDEIQRLINLIKNFQGEIDKYVRKNWEFDVSIMPVITEQQQKLKLKAEYDIEISEASINKLERIRNIESEVNKLREKGFSDEEIESFRKAALFNSDEIFRQQTLLAQKKFGANFNKITQEWIDEDLKKLREYTDRSLEELLQSTQERGTVLENQLEDILQRFTNVGIGRGKPFRFLFESNVDAALKNIGDVENIEKKQAQIKFQREKEDIDKRFKFERQEYTVAAGDKEEFEKQQDALALKMYFEKLNALRLANLNYNSDIEKAEKKAGESRDKAQKDSNDKWNQYSDERKNRIFDEVQASVDAAFTIANAAIEAEMMKNDALISLQEERVRRAVEIADKGGAELLQAEEDRLVQLQKARAKFVRQQQALIFAQTVAEASLAVARAASTGSGVLSPILVASTIASLVAGYIAARGATQAAIGGFAEGGWTGKGGKYEPAGVVHREEFVVKKGPAERWRPMLEQINKGRDPMMAAGMGKQVIMINNVGVEERLSRIEKAITGQERMQLTIDESGIHGLVSHYQWKNDRIRNRAK
jgi:tape measure domain-containing protein